MSQPLKDGTATPTGEAARTDEAGPARGSRRRVTRVIGALLAIAAVALLAGCEKPLPRITVQTGAFSTTITPSKYCFTSTACRQAAKVDLPVVTAKGQNTVLVDVPREVANTDWILSALTLDGSKNLGSSGVLHGTHTYRLVNNTNNGDPFIVEVDQVRNGKPDGSRWSFLVRVTQG